MEFKVKQEILASGLTLLTIPMPSESVTAILLVRVGSRDETKKSNGISHFFEHMTFKGTQKWPTTQDVNRVIDSVGGIFNAFTSQEHTGFWVKLAKKQLPLALEFLYQTVFCSRLPEPELERERNVIIEEIKMYEDDPMAKVFRAFVSQVYSLTPLGWDITGPAENIKTLKREEFFTHLEKWYQPRNMVLVLAGGIAKNTKILVENYFIRTKKAAFLPRRSKFSYQQTKPKTQVIEKKIEQAHFCLGVRSFERTNKNRYVLALLNTILGGNTSSRLWNEIREKRGLAYYVKSSVDSFLETGYLVTQAACDVNKLSEAIRLTQAEYQKIALEPVKPQELNLAKEYLKGRLTLALEDNKDVAEEFGESLLLEDRVRTIKEIIKGVEVVTQDQVQAVAKKIFSPKQLNLTIVSPKTGRKSKWKKAELFS